MSLSLSYWATGEILGPGVSSSGYDAILPRIIPFRKSLVLPLEDICTHYASHYALFWQWSDFPVAEDYASGSGTSHSIRPSSSGGGGSAFGQQLSAGEIWASSGQGPRPWLLSHPASDSVLDLLSRLTHAHGARMNSDRFQI